MKRKHRSSIIRKVSPIFFNFVTFSRKFKSFFISHREQLVKVTHDKNFFYRVIYKWFSIMGPDKMNLNVFYIFVIQFYPNTLLNWNNSSNHRSSFSTI